MTKPEIILVEPMMPAIEARLDADYTVHRLFEPAGRDGTDVRWRLGRGAKWGGAVGRAGLVPSNRDGRRRRRVDHR